MSRTARKSVRTPMKRRAGLRLPSAPQDGYRHPTFSILVWRGNNWVIEGSGEPFSITEELDAIRKQR